MKPIIYLAHPVSGDARANVDRALKWLRFLSEADETRIYVAPWIGEVLAHIDLDPVPQDFYERVLADDEDIIRRFDGILLAGVGNSGSYRRANDTIKSTGMTRELAASVLDGGLVFNLSRFGTADEAAVAFRTWGLPGADFINSFQVNP